MTKERHPQTFEKIKSLRRELKNNQKNIRNMERAIRKDKDESQYDLGKFNSELKELEEELERIDADKKAAFKKFDAETKAAIAAQIAAEFATGLDPLRKEHDEIYEQQRYVEENIKKLSMKLTSEYNSYLGKENLDIQMIAALIRIMEVGRAATVADALAVYRSEPDAGKELEGNPESNTGGEQEGELEQDTEGERREEPEPGTSEDKSIQEKEEEG